MTLQSDFQGKFRRIKLFKNNLKLFAKVWQSVCIAADMKHFNLALSHLIWIQQQYAKAFLESNHCNLIPIHCLFTHKHFCAYEKLLCEGHTHTHSSFPPPNCPWRAAELKCVRPGESVNRSKSDFADLRKTNNQPVQLHENVQKMRQGKSISEGINL